VVILSQAPIFEVKGRYNPRAVEHVVELFWKQHDIPRKVRVHSWQRDGPVFSFLEGPPTANGYMHVGHARGRTYKDVMLRYARMKGMKVWDRAGWDTQGLPVELEVEKNFGVKSKKDIENVLGVERFVEECSKLVDHYIQRWREDSEKLGLWLDYDKAYETRNPKYIEFAWRFLREMWNRGYLYEDFRVVPVCPRCETALSQHEVALGYKEVSDPSLYFKVRLRVDGNVYAIVWTTTPWTIISNEALAVHPDEVYVKIRVSGEIWILAEKRLEAFTKEVEVSDFEIVGKLYGRELLGVKYEHPLIEEVPVHREHEGMYAHAIVTAEWVKMDEGTGIVHVAPVHGPEDFETAKRYGIPIDVLIQKNGVFTNRAGKYSGKWFLEASKEVVEDLKRRGLVVRVGTIVHEYPHCWRCETPLMFYADRQWYIKVEPIKEIMLRENESVIWRPKSAYDRFKDWLQNARDWCISRERYWGTPLPIWTCRSCGYRIVVGSLDELRKYAENPSDIVDVHRPWIDRVVLKCPKCGGLMFREPYVVDVWLDSGIAHTASLTQYGDESLFNALFPYAWITEAIDQTRGWFYTLLLTSVALYGRSPFRQVLCQGLVLDKYGKKMSKSRGNVRWAREEMEKYGVDVLRIYLTMKAAPWDNINYDPDELPDVRAKLDILWNVASFFDMYARLDRWSASSLSNDFRHLMPEDHWILHSLLKTLDAISKDVENGNMHTAVRTLINFIVENVSHRYITLIRPRVWLEEESPEKKSAYATLFTVLKNTLKLVALFAPYIAEYLYQAVVKKYDPTSHLSIHMERLDIELPVKIDEMKVESVEELLKVSEHILSMRSAKGLKRRWPIKRVVILVSDESKLNAYRESASIITRYANVKEVVFDFPTKADAYSGLECSNIDGVGLVCTDFTVDEELLLEGLARDVIRRIQVLRKELSLPIDAKIKSLKLFTQDEELFKAITKHKSYIAVEVRAEHIEISKSSPPPQARKWDIEGKTIYCIYEL